MADGGTLGTQMSEALAKLDKEEDGFVVPDLLSLEAAVRVDRTVLRQTLVFAFAMGGTVEAFDRVLATAVLPPSGWSMQHFARDLFLDDLVQKTLSIRIGERVYQPAATYLLRAIAEPPESPAVIAFRRGVVAELDQKPELRRGAEALYQDLVRLRAQLASSREAAPRLRRLEILRALRAIFDRLATSFEGAKSGLARLDAFGKGVRESDSYIRLDALLDHEDHLATVDVRVRVGADGELNAFQIVGVRAHKENPFYTSWLGRFFARFGLFLRGYRLTGGEVVENLFEDVFAGLEPALVMLFQLVGDLEFYLAGLSLADRGRKNGLGVCLPGWIEGDGPGLEARGLWNPLLLGDGSKPVPCDLTTAHDGAVVVVTGPNSGGKTRLLQAIGIAQMLAEAGLFAPCKSARLRRAAGMFVSLVEEARSDQPEGQLGMELIRIRRLFEELSVGSLVLLDELCSGTNPSEGEEIAELVLSLLPEIKARAYITTHLLRFAARLAEERPIEALEFLQVELDESERPTFGFVAGVAKTSLAKKTAARLGVTREELEDLIAAKKRAAGLASSREPDKVSPVAEAAPSNRA